MPHADVLDTQEPARAVLFPLRLLGVGLFFAWDWFLHGDLVAGVGETRLTPAFTPSIVTVEVLTLVVLALASRRLGSLGRHPAVVAAAAVAAFAGSLLVVVGARGLLPAALCATGGGALVGFSSAVLVLTWAEVYARMESGQVFRYGALSLLAAVAVYGVALGMTEAARAVVAVCIPVASFAAAWASVRFVGPEPLAVGAPTRYKLPWKPVAIMGVCGFAAAFVDVTLFAQGTSPHILADLLVGAALVAAVLGLRRPVRPVVLVGVALACVAAGIVAVALFGERAGFAASLLTMASYVTMTFFTCALLANICRRYGVPSLWLFGFAVAARTLMDHVGGFAHLAFPRLGELASSPWELAVMAVVGLVMVGVVALLWMSERSFQSTWAVEPVDAGTVRGPSPAEALALRLEEVAAVHDLTDREAEILAMLVAGDTYQQMCQALLLSPNTVKTHARHLYGKLGVHTRAEAVALVERAG